MTTPTDHYNDLAAAGLQLLASVADVPPSGTVTVNAGGDTVKIDVESGAVVAANPTVTA